MTDQRVLITGADGQLGRALTASFADRAAVTALSRAQFDIRDARRAADVVAAVAPSVIFNCAAYNDVDAAEDDPTTALEVNAMALGGLARAALACGARLVHFSSDFVFDGTAGRPYDEDDPPSPRSTYAASKMVGEWFTRDAGEWMVLRVESLFGARHWPGTRRLGSIDRILDAIEQGQPARVFHDRVVSPSYLPDVAAATRALVDRPAPSGIYHVVNSGHCTWLELAQEAARLLGGGAAGIVPVSVADVPLTAARPRFAALSNARLGRIAYRMPAWQDALARYIAFRRGGRQAGTRP
jgi:dTDP-4-dehydrorhamnose reductase